MNEVKGNKPNRQKYRLHSGKPVVLYIKLCKIIECANFTDVIYLSVKLLGFLYSSSV